ncbi:acyl-CoA carboxylase epsilon subunit [Cryobacterium sp.]|jgi:hypothetical protein|uniref:acyl-CoA carboxylase epsilon subunit n=1 Tax=Cryobacterium sp. TaxID=1926290 RepID=UPI0026349305|nr:acyl-CoA carboxylase epsilon subunit [Cryobacterium sp.]MCU1447550.1 hypothetical protein [Cryobacterium sp.]
MTDTQNPGGLDPADLIFLTGGVTDQEAAAVTAVLRALLREESDSLRASPAAARSAWRDNQRAIRADLARADDRRRSFTG